MISGYSGEVYVCHPALAWLPCKVLAVKAKVDPGIEAAIEADQIGQKFGHNDASFIYRIIRCIIMISATTDDLRDDWYSTKVCKL